MRILHCCLSCFYIDDYNYQENVLPIINKEDGHDVYILASTETFIDNNKIGYIRPAKYYSKEGILIERIPYMKYLPHFLMKKIRHYKETYKKIERFNPDIIFFHGVPAFDLLTVSKYVKDNPSVKLYVDSHEDYNNSATNILSKIILHKLFYKRIIKKSDKFIDKYFCIGSENFEFIEDMYGVQKEKMEFFPLGGRIKPDNELKSIRENVRSSLGLKSNDILIVHSGKLNKAKKTDKILAAFLKAKNENLYLLIIGSADEETIFLINKATRKNKKINYLGWKSAEELLEYVAACDLYLQPGTKSATMQNALCSNVPVAVYPYNSYTYYLNEDSAFFVKTEKDIETLLKTINKEVLEKKRKVSFEIAKRLLDYNMQAKRISN